MAHILARLGNVKLEDVKAQLAADAAVHTEQGIYLDHVWQNADDAEEVLFLFRVNDLETVKRRMDEVHAQVRQENP